VSRLAIVSKSLATPLSVKVSPLKTAFSLVTVLCSPTTNTPVLLIPIVL
jgi:hypothetical protein